MSATARSRPGGFPGSTVGTSDCPGIRSNDATECSTGMTDETASGDPDLADVVGVLDDEHVRSILVATSEEPLSATELGERCDLSVSSIYRRVGRLCTLDLLEERTRPRRDGHHETVYVSVLDRFELTIRDGELTWTVDRTGSDVADELSRLWGNF